MDPNAGKRDLVNKLDKESLRAKLEAESFHRITLSFYKYVIIDNPQKLRDALFEKWMSLDCLGRIYVSREGINAQMNVPEHHWEEFEQHLYAIDYFKDVPFKIAVTDKTDGKSFLKLKVKVRGQIVADGLQPEDYDVTNVGAHLSAKDWNDAIENEDPIVVDMRNHYESEIGHFKNAVCPDVDTFRDSLDLIEEQLRDHKESKKLVMYCTGGIRCEKASAYYKHKGFKQVYQLEGGIIEYTRQVRAQGLENKFLGKNFVFDERRAECISEDVIAVCHQCGSPCDTHVNCANSGCHLLFIQCESCASKMNHCCSEECMDIVALPEEEQKALRKGKTVSNKIFKKGRSPKLKYKA